ncbi:MAG: hypothetical protein KatS3mg106_641 [Gemmataceae bacterium]|nr:MAG: hypothetical protein KatS3mg106_641 [Gemmataceae bacterium]
MNPAWRARYEVARTAVRQAGQLARRYFHATALAVEQKVDQTPVTVADREAEALLRHVLSDAFPDDGFLGEEYGNQSGSSGYRWIVDPIDGTKSFIRHIPLWATLLGLEYQGELIAGVVYAPEMDRLYHALRGEGAYVNDRPLRVSQVSALDQALPPLAHSPQPLALGFFCRPGGEGGCLPGVGPADGAAARLWGFLRLCSGGGRGSRHHDRPRPESLGCRRADSDHHRSRGVHQRLARPECFHQQRGGRHKRLPA